MASIEERFWPKVQKTESCWLWTGGLSDTGYGSISMNGKIDNAHRVAWKLMRGPIPAGMQLDHLCRVRHCVNPDHLEIVTRRTNILRGLGQSAIYARRETCGKGHPLKDPNLYHTKSRPNTRICKVCFLERRARYLNKSRGETHGIDSVK